MRGSSRTPLVRSQPGVWRRSRSVEIVAYKSNAEEVLEGEINKNKSPKLIVSQPGLCTLETRT